MRHREKKERLSLSCCISLALPVTTTAPKYLPLRNAMLPKLTLSFSSSHLIPRTPRAHKRLIVAMAMPASKFRLAIKAQGEHGAVLQGSLGLDKVKTIFLLLNSGSMGAMLLLAWNEKFEGSVSDPISSPSNLSKWFMCHCLPPFFFFSNLFHSFICLLSLSGYYHGLQLHSRPLV